MAELEAPRSDVRQLVDELKVLHGTLTDLHTQRMALRTQVQGLIDCLVSGAGLGAVPASAGARLNVMTLNLQYYSSYPKDKAAAHTKLRQATCIDLPGRAADVIAVQEGIASMDVLSELGYEQIVCAGKQGLAQSVREMVYHDEGTLKVCPDLLHDELLCNQLYVRRGCGWHVAASGVEKISSDLDLQGGGDRCTGRLAIRTMVWVKLEKPDREGALYVMCTHITGGRFEDQYFVQQLSQERRMQPERCVEFFEKKRPNPSPKDAAIFVGDFNALAEYDCDGPMHGYFKFGIVNSKGVALDAQSRGLDSEEKIEDCFKTYMVSPFVALRELGWKFVYGRELGITSSFGHLIDHMATSGPLRVESAEIKYLTNQKMGNKAEDTDLVITDHNAVMVGLSF